MTYEFSRVDLRGKDKTAATVVFNHSATGEVLRLDAVDFLLGRYPEKNRIKSKHTAKALGEIMKGNIFPPVPSSDMN